MLSSKQKDFERFAKIVDLMKKGRHLNKAGLRSIITQAFVMNGGGKYRKLKLADILRNLESSETVRQDPANRAG